MKKKKKKSRKRLNKKQLLDRELSYITSEEEADRILHEREVGLNFNRKYWGKSNWGMD